MCSACTDRDVSIGCDVCFANKELLTINEKNTVSIHICEKAGGKLMDTVETFNEAEGRHLLRRYWITLT